MKKTLITNIGKIVSGDLQKGIIESDTISVEDGLIAGIGSQSQFDSKSVEKIVDANGMVVTPGFIDSHTHPGFEDYKASIRVDRWMETCLLAGTTTMISATTFVPGMVLEPLFVKCLAILAQKNYQRFRPGGYLKCHAGTVVLVDGLTENDFREMADAGVFLFSEIGCMGLAQPKDIKQMVEWGRKYGMIISMHCGGATIIGSTAVNADMLLEVKPDLVAHVNGGSTALSLEETEKIVNESDFTLEVMHNGNLRMTCEVVRMLKEKGELRRLIIGSDNLTGIGFLPLVINRMVTHISSLCQIPAQDAIACATGNTADRFRLNTGKIEVGREADILIIDRPPGSVGSDALGSIEAGDTVGTAMVMVDGHIVTFRGRDTRPTVRNVRVNGVEHIVDSFAEWVHGQRYPEY